MSFETIRWQGGCPGSVRILDQTLLPLETRYIELSSVDEMFEAISRLAVRGAPAIGVAAAYGVLLGVQHGAGESALAVFRRADSAAATLIQARPTAINLSWSLQRMVARAAKQHTASASGASIVEALFEEAHAIFEEDRAICRRIGEVGATLIGHGQSLLTHCNAGGLASSDFGTALAPIFLAKDQGKQLHVFVDETRPLLQGARLTTWELMQAGIAATLITDSMAGRVMYEGRVDAVFVGADRIARNGDVCNKIGTYSVAVLAREHGIPFYVCAPLSSFDAEVESGAEIPIEQRDPLEITEGFGPRTAPPGVAVYNPAFDVTPARLVSAIVTEIGLIERPDTESVVAALRRGGCSV
ncbi:MAG TPA: S-methyl-5-thioribose-1-phosphate isomerase [Planctomycetota bacterium]|nr:S-methyl-5-thioribose-1-phosphate isomerase [Planctomycetota bacterium]